MTTRPVGGMQFDELPHGFNKVLELKSFAELGQTPKITRAQVVVCFADIRRFTNLVERAQKAGGEAATDLLCDFFSIFPKAVLREAWDLDHDGPRGDAFQKSVREHIFPSFWKRLGDGMLIVWDFTSVADEQLKSGVRLAILDILGFVQEYFYEWVDRKDEERIFAPLGVDLGIGLAKGEAWKLDFGVGGQIDYVGSPLNLAARLQDLARPRGICVQGKFAPTYLVERTGTGEGKIEHLDIRGVDKRIPVWKSERRTLWIRRPRTTCVGDDDFSIGSQFMIPPYEERPSAGTNNRIRRGISEADIESLLETRRKCEARFASEAARLMTAPAGSELRHLLSRTKSIIQTATKEQFREIGQRFHEGIARLGGPEEKAKERVALVQSLHEWTTKIYPEAQADRVKITEEHEAIINAVLEGLPDVAAERMREHLKKHDGRVIEEALSEPT
jgi:class 3 adenylate cyclase